ncbi:hypothetical protein ACM40_18215 [Chryseobacterium sp. BLS98]|nr:hypothetical protein ACM40_18215 [Chryseobacterium sp. BLS98]
MFKKKSENFGELDWLVDEKKSVKLYKAWKWILCAILFIDVQINILYDLQILILERCITKQKF